MTLRSPYTALGALACLAAMATPLQAEEVLLTTVKDNSIWQDSQGDVSNGKGQHLFAGRTGLMGLFNVRRAFVAFDVAGSVPAGATIEEVELTLVCSKSSSSESPIDLHRVLADWGEGDSAAQPPEGQGAPAEPGDVTWLHTFYDTDFWLTPGGDFELQASGTQMVGFSGTYTWDSTAAMVADVQAWLDDPSANFGWLLKGNESGVGNAKRFDSKDHIDPGVWPQLRIVYSSSDPLVYCTAKSGLTCGLPAMSFSGVPSATQSSGFEASAQPARALRSGLVLYSANGRAAIAFQGGTLCVAPPLRRTVPVNSGGVGACDGVFSIDLNAFAQGLLGGNPDAFLQMPGQRVNAQWWGRDSLATGSFLSDGLEYVVGP